MDKFKLLFSIEALAVSSVALAETKVYYEDTKEYAECILTNISKAAKEVIAACETLHPRLRKTYNPWEVVSEKPLPPSTAN